MGWVERLRRVCALSVLVFMVLVLPSVRAETTYTIPLEGGRWSIPNIPVHVPATPPLAHNLTIEALAVWNASLTWFTETYFQNMPLYSFVLADPQHALVQVNYEDSNTIREETGCGIGGQGCTAPLPLGNGIFHITVTIAIARTWNSVQSTTAHEFGHVLGLGHVAYPNDLMNRGPLNTPLIPSTLDLYAVYSIKTNISRNLATLPSNIPYSEAPVVIPTPEFGTAILPIAVGLLAIIPQIMVRRRSKLLRCQG